MENNQFYYTPQFTVIRENGRYRSVSYLKAICAGKLWSIEIGDDTVFLLNGSPDTSEFNFIGQDGQMTATSRGGPKYPLSQVKDLINKMAWMTVDPLSIKHNIDGSRELINIPNTVIQAGLKRIV